VKELLALGMWDEEMLSDLKYFDGSVQGIERVPEDVKRLYKTAFEIQSTWLLQCAAVRQKWLDQSQSVNLFLAENDARKASFMYREAWDRGLKTTYYLRTINKSAIDSSNRERRKVEVEPAPTASSCSIEAMRNGTVCESCQ
jgi:ribonucleoside-diphosphate reductase alpha chain